jgi:hypothetical protein
MAFIVHPLMRPMPTEAFLSRGVMLEWDIHAEAELVAGGTVEPIRGKQIELALVEWVGSIPQEPEDPLPGATITVRGQRFGIHRSGPGMIGVRWLATDHTFGEALEVS